MYRNTNPLLIFSAHITMHQGFIKANHSINFINNGKFNTKSSEVILYSLRKLKND